jgi:hypothetical protein
MKTLSNLRAALSPYRTSLTLMAFAAASWSTDAPNDPQRAVSATTSPPAISAECFPGSGNTAPEAVLAKTAHRT